MSEDGDPLVVRWAEAVVRLEALKVQMEAFRVVTVDLDRLYLDMPPDA